jgi:hypothetical protein
MNPTVRNYLIIVLFGLVVCISFNLFQAPNNFSVNPKADANEYLKIYQYFHGGGNWNNIRFGIHNRLTIPFLASLLPWENAILNFFIINSILAIISVVSLYHLLEYFRIRPSFTWLALVFFALHYVGPFRQNAIGPINVDIAVYLLEIWFLIFILKRQYLLLILLTPIAIATKELFLALIIVVFVFAVILRFIFNDQSFSIPLLAITLAIGILTKFILNHYFPSANPDRNSILVMAFHIREMIFHPDHLWRWILSLFAAMAGFLFLVIKKYPVIKLQNNPGMMVHFLSLSVLALSIAGGMDYTRLIFLGFPYLIISIILIAAPSKNEFLFTWIISMLLTRFWLKLPVISMDMSPYNEWMPESADKHYLIIWTAIMIFGYAAFRIWKKYFVKPTHP